MDAMDLLRTSWQASIGMRLGNRYRIIQDLGQGEMAKVFLSHDEKLNIPIALKMMRPDLAADERALKAIINGAKLAIQLDHPNIVRLYNLETFENVPFLAMEYITGPTLDTILVKREKVTIEECTLILKNLIPALDYSHEQNILHCDLKPSNIFLHIQATDIWERQGKELLMRNLTQWPNFTTKIGDFGIARQIRDFLSRTLRIDSYRTLVYMSPEQLVGRKLTFASDIYSLGVVLYEMLSGHPPFYTGALEHQILHVPPEPIENLPEPYQKIILCCLEKNPEQRYKKAVDIIEDWQAKPEKIIIFDDENKTNVLQQIVPSLSASIESISNEIERLKIELAEEKRQVALAEQQKKELELVYLKEELAKEKKKRKELSIQKKENNKIYSFFLILAILLTVIFYFLLKVWK